MDALRGSALKLFLEKSCGNEGLFCKRKEPLFLTFPHNHVNNLSFSFSKSLHKKKPIFPLSSLSSSDTQMQLDIQDKETEAYDLINQSKTVRVRFQLHRECSFGQRFHIVGDDPMLGQWDPSGAVPFNWSDGHVWTTTELDVPLEKCIKYKIILKHGPENIIWQPGPDRILQTWETENTITICEDWDSAECQKILEEDQTFNQIEESIITAQEITQPKKQVDIDKSNTIPGRGLVSNAKESPAISDDDMNMLMLGGIGSMMNVEDSKLTTDEMLSTNELPVLVPGLNPLPTTQPEEISLKEVEKKIFSDDASIEADRFKDLNMPELELEQFLDNDYKEKHQDVQVANPQFAEDEGQQYPKSYDHVVENNKRWGLRTLQKLIANFGIQ